MKKPTVYIVSNLGGGVRKSTSIAHLVFALQERNQDPIIVALDTNATLESLLPDGTDIMKWDLNNETESHEGLRAVLTKSAQSGRPAVLDLAALGGDSFGIKTLLRTKMLDMCEVVSVVPILPSQKSIVEASKALALVQPDKWFLVQYGTKNSQRIYDDLMEFKQLKEMSPDAIIRPSELTDAEAQSLQKEDSVLNKMGEVTAVNPFGTFHLQIFVGYWSELSRQYNEVLDIINLDQDDSKRPEKTTA